MNSTGVFFVQYVIHTALLGFASQLLDLPQVLSSVVCLFVCSCIGMSIALTVELIDDTENMAFLATPQGRHSQRFSRS